MQKTLQSPLRRNKSFMNGFFKSVLHRMNRNTKIIKIFSKKLKKKKGEIYYSNKLLKYTVDFKKPWNVMKDIIGKSKIKSANVPCKLTINKVNVYNKPEIVNTFNDPFTNIGQGLASQIPKSSKTFETYINKVNVIMGSEPLSINGLKDTLFLLKINKSSGVDDVGFNIIEKCFGVLCEPLIYLFHLSLKNCKSDSDL